MAAALFWVGWPVSSDRVLGTMGPGCSKSNNSDIPKKKALCTFYVHSTILKISASLEKTDLGGRVFFPSQLAELGKPGKAG